MICKIQVWLKRRQTVKRMVESPIKVRDPSPEASQEAEMECRRISLLLSINRIYIPSLATNGLRDIQAVQSTTATFLKRLTYPSKMTVSFSSSHMKQRNPLNFLSPPLFAPLSRCAIFLLSLCLMIIIISLSSIYLSKYKLMVRCELLLTER